MLIKHGRKDYVACLVGFVPDRPDKVTLYPIDRVLALNPQTDTDRVIAQYFGTPEQVAGHPWLDVADEAATVTITPQKRRFIERTTEMGGYVILARACTNAVYICRTTITSLGLTETQLNWLNVYVQFTHDYLPELKAKMAGKEEAAPVATKPEPRPSKPKLKAKERRRAERRRRLAAESEYNYAHIV